MADLVGSIADIALETGFSGAVRVDIGHEAAFLEAFGSADRAAGVPNRVDGRFAIASGVKGLTALTIASLVEDGVLALDTPARSLLGADLPLIGDGVTVEHLLGHRSGIGDYLDEDLDDPIDAYPLSVPVHRLATTEDYLAVLDGHEAKAAPDEEFSYCNGGYAVLALLAERAAGTPFPDLVAQRVCAPAGMRATEFLRSDELPAGAARGYLYRDGLRTNVLHLPVRGSGDGGAYSTVADMEAFWRALFEGRIVPEARVAEMVRPRSTTANGALRYGLGFWLAPQGATVLLEGYDAGVSFRSAHDPERAITWTVVANTSEGAWPIARHIETALSS